LEDARFCPNLIKFAQNLITFGQISHKFVQIFPYRPNLPNFDQKTFPRDAAASPISPAPTALTKPWKRGKSHNDCDNVVSCR